MSMIQLTETSEIKEPSTLPRPVTRSELALHKAPDVCWIAIDGFVYDLHDFGRRHSGGSILFRYGGIDASMTFHRMHDECTSGLEAVMEKMKQFLIGPLIDDGDISSVT